MFDSLLSAIISGLSAGLIAYGGMRVELRWLHEKIKSVDQQTKHAHLRLDQLMEARIRKLEADEILTRSMRQNIPEDN